MKMKAKLHLEDIQDVNHLQSFSQSLCAIQSFIFDCSSVDNVNNYSDGSEPFYIWQIQQVQATARLHTKRCYTDLLLPNIQKQTLISQMQTDTAADVNIMLVSVYRKSSPDYSLSRLVPIQTKIKVYNSTIMNIIGSCVQYHHAHNEHKL